jgi:hypothetical protein
MERGGSSLFSLVCRSEAMTLAPAATAPNHELNPKRPHAFTHTDLHRAHDSHFTVFISRLGVRLSKSLISLPLIPRHASSAVLAQLPMVKDWVLGARECRAVKYRKWRWLVERLENAVHPTSCPSPLSVVRLLIPPPSSSTCALSTARHAIWPLLVDLGAQSSFIPSTVTVVHAICPASIGIALSAFYEMSPGQTDAV